MALGLGQVCCHLALTTPCLSESHVKPDRASEEGLLTGLQRAAEGGENTWPVRAQQGEGAGWHSAEAWAGSPNKSSAAFYLLSRDAEPEWSPASSVHLLPT